MAMKFTRRSFLEKSSQAYLTAAAASTLGLGGLLSSHASIAANTDYKALVFIFLAGGNDSFNMIAPQESGVLRERYEGGRGFIALDAQDMHPLELKNQPAISGDDDYNGYKDFGLHPACSDMANLFNEGSLAIVANMGNLVQPTTREQILDESAILPPSLYSHSDQQRQFQSAPLSNIQHGWGGRTAELLTSHNPGEISPLISMAGLNTFQLSRDSHINTYAMNPSGNTKVKGLSGARKRMLEDYMASAASHSMSRKYQDTFESARHASSIISTALDIADASDVDYEGIFTSAGANETSLGKQLKMIAKKIVARSAFGNQRPVYFVKVNGFDTHKNHLADHAELMAELNSGLKAFSDTLKEQNDFDKVLSVIGSEFGRTFSPNGNTASSGTDHAWGGNGLIMGGMVDGGKVFGTYPDLVLGGEVDADGNKQRGRWIPQHATSEVAAMAAHWFGIEQNDLFDVFPTLSNFPGFDLNNPLLSYIREGV